MFESKLTWLCECDCKDNFALFKNIIVFFSSSYAKRLTWRCLLIYLNSFDHLMYHMFLIVTLFFLSYTLLVWLAWLCGLHDSVNASWSCTSFFWEEIGASLHYLSSLILHLYLCINVLINLWFNHKFSFQSPQISLRKVTGKDHIFDSRKWSTVVLA